MAIMDREKSAQGIDLGEMLGPEDPLRAICERSGKRSDAACAGDFFWDADQGIPSCWQNMRAEVQIKLRMSEKKPEEPIDASVSVWILGGQMEAWCVAYPPLNGGRELEPNDFYATFAQRQVVSGLDEELIKQLAEGREYLRMARIAMGTPPVDGVDGKNIELIPMPEKGSLKEDERGKVNFKELDLIVNVEAGQQIIAVVPPVPGEEGRNVCGGAVRAKPGRPAPKMAGKNTRYSSDGKFLLASQDGQLMLVNGKYNVNEVITISGNVDYATGNIKANGSVVITGSVCANFTVEAKNDIEVRGTVDGGTLIAGGDIIVRGGVIANNTGFIKARGDIRCRFMEYGVAYAGRNAYFENLIHSSVSCEGGLFVTTGRGVVIAGSLQAMGNIEINSLGNRAYRATNVTIGCTDAFTENKHRLQREFHVADEKRKEIEANIEKLKEHADNPQVQMMIRQLTSNLTIEKLKHQNLDNELKEVEAKEEEMKKSRVFVNRAYPNSVISINGCQITLHSEIDRVYFRERDGVVVSVPR